MNSPRWLHSYIARDLFMVTVFFSIVLILQWRSGALSNEFGGYSDESAHVVNGLLVRDYIASDRSVQPVQFAERYYLHYPKVSIGHWPPVFYVIQALWTLLFSVGRVPLLLLMAAMASAIASTLFVFLRREFSTAIAAGASVLFLLLPITQRYSSMVMADIPLSMFLLWSILAFGRYLKTYSWHSGLIFAIFAALAILTKASAISLAGVPIIALILSSKLSALKRLSFWSAGLIVLVVVGPWYWWTRGMVQSTWTQPYPSPQFAWTAARFYASQFLRFPSYFLFPVVLLGIYEMIIQPSRAGRLRGTGASIAAGIFCIFLVNITIPAGIGERFLLPSLPLLILLFAAGIQQLANSAKAFYSNDTIRNYICISIGLGIFFLTGFTVSRTPFDGYSAAVNIVMSESKPEKRPGHIIVRASKILCRSNWLGTENVPLFFDAGTMESYLKNIPIMFIVTDDSIPSNRKLGYHDLLEQMVQLHPSAWSMVGSCHVNRGARHFQNALKIYRFIGAPQNHPAILDIPIPLLGKSIRSK